jgi:LssY C-terminus
MRAFLFMTAVGLFAQSSRSVDISVPADQAWTDTAVDLNAGDSLTITATGSVTFQGKQISADGAARGWADVVKAYPVNEAGRGALIGRIGNADTALVFLVGANKQLKSPKTGRLFLGVNIGKNDSGSDAFQVKLEIITAAPNAAAADVKLPRIPERILEELPKRVVDKDGNQGDAVNFFIIGSEAKLKEAYKNAGWVLVDKTKRDAVLHGLLSTLSKQSYVEMPMSELMMFGRSQDFGYAHAEPVQVVSTRHHLRIWKSPYQVAGQQLWVGAATHDIGFERDQRNNGVTHKIDPAIDGEREYLGQTLSETGIIAKMDYLTPRNPLKEEHTATGGSFKTDGRVLVMLLTPDTPVITSEK